MTIDELLSVNFQTGPSHIGETMATRLSAGLSGTAGEFFVAAELSRRGFIVSLTARATKGIDIFAANLQTAKSVAIQVKTNQGGKEWVLKKFDKQDTAQDLFYVFVRLKDVGMPEFHVVPRSDVITFAESSHAKWMSTLRRDGRKHKENDMRKFADPENQYKDGWDILGLDRPAVGRDRKHGLRIGSPAKSSHP